ncbi:MAG: HD domain-containing protein [Desulfobacteraceae bacterium]|nr:HD domain-containing protein [Desulfobacteraceae bacterium]
MNQKHSTNNNTGSAAAIIQPGRSQDDDALTASVRKIAQKAFTDARGSHDWDHSLRVVALCERIGPLENADMLVLRPAAYLHDIGRAAQDASNGSICHAVKGARITSDLLEPMPLSHARKENIIHCVRSHRFRDRHRPKTKEAMVLFDADKLDAIGAVGIARAYLFAGELGACLHNYDIPVEKAEPYSKNDTGFREYAVKLSKIKNRILTKEGQRLANERHAFMEAFFKRFLLEIKGKD